MRLIQIKNALNALWINIRYRFDEDDRKIKKFDDAPLKIRTLSISNAFKKQIKKG